MALEDAIAALAGYQQADLGIQSHAVAPESVNVPCVVNYPESGEMSYAGVDLGRAAHVVRSDLLISRNDGGGLATADAKLRPYITRYRDVLAAHYTLGGTVNLIQDVAYEYGVIEWAGMSYMGIRFRQTLVIKETLVLAP